MSLTIRPVTRADYDRWLPLWEGYNAFYKRVGPTAVPIEVTNLTWQRFFDGYEPMHALVAESGDKLAGFTHYLFHRNTTMIGPVCYLQDLFTDATLRGKGVGKALIEGVYERARLWTARTCETRHGPAGRGPRFARAVAGAARGGLL
jgi:GNAT superfamily N-acetyltransferase